MPPLGVTVPMPGRTIKRGHSKYAVRSRRCAVEVSGWREAKGWWGGLGHSLAIVSYLCRPTPCNCPVRWKAQSRVGGRLGFKLVWHASVQEISMSSRVQY